MTNQSGAAEQTKFIPAFNDTVSPLRHRRRIGRALDNKTLADRAPGLKPANRYDRRGKIARIKHVDRRPPLNHNDSGGADPAKSSHKSDLAFQHAMRCAIARGLENPPQVGIVKDRRPLTAPRLFEPVPHSSGCTSPALECADLVPPSD